MEGGSRILLKEVYTKRRSFVNVQNIRDMARGITAVPELLPGMARLTPPLKIPAAALGALAVGAFALGAFAVGALAIGSLGIGRLSAHRVRFRSLKVDELQVGTLRIRETQGEKPEAVY